MRIDKTGAIANSRVTLSLRRAMDGASVCGRRTRWSKPKGNFATHWCVKPVLDTRVIATSWFDRLTMTREHATGSIL